MGRSRQGADWLIERWEGLGEALGTNGGWDEPQRRLAFDLLVFQAEDGIRGLYVTGVQTCAFRSTQAEVSGANEVNEHPLPDLIRAADLGLSRSEERRVGKECRSRWSPYR